MHTPFEPHFDAADNPFGPGFGPSFGGGPHAGHRGRGHGRPHGRGHGRPHGRGHGRGRSRRGDVRTAILKLLTDRPMHGYEMIQEIAERSQNLWKPSPGSVYPTLQLLEDEGLIVAAESEGTRKLFALSETGRTAAEGIESAPWDEIAQTADPTEVALRTALNQLFGAAGQAAQAGTAEQQQRVVDIVNNARREIYQILGEA